MLTPKQRLIKARDEFEPSMKRAIFQFRNDRKPNPLDVEDMKKHFTEMLAILEEAAPGKDARREAAITRAQEEDSKSDWDIQDREELEQLGEG